MCHLYPRVKFALRFCSTITIFLHDWGFSFSIGYNDEFQMFEKLSLKVGNFKNPKCSFVRTNGRKI